MGGIEMTYIPEEILDTIEGHTELVPQLQKMEDAIADLADGAGTSSSGGFSTMKAFEPVMCRARIPLDHAAGDEGLVSMFLPDDVLTQLPPYINGILGWQWQGSGGTFPTSVTPLFPYI